MTDDLEARKRAATADGLNFSFALLRAYPTREEGGRTDEGLHEQLLAVDGLIERQWYGMVDRHKEFALPGILHGLAIASAGFLDHYAERQGTTREALLDELQFNLIMNAENRRQRDAE
jgi:hypothetical protein